MIVTIDGPAVSGKTTVSRMLAEKLGFYYLGSGLLYRALAYLLRMQRGYTDAAIHAPCPDDIRAVLDPKKFLYTYDSQYQDRIIFQGQVLAMAELRTPAIAHDASLLATDHVVRDALRVVQRAIADNHNLIAEGRDAGSVVFPDADIKFFITASVAERARRFAHDQAARGTVVGFDEAVTLIEQRDDRDKKRTLDPLVIPAGAMVVDTTQLSLETVVAMLEREIQKKQMA